MATDSGQAPVLEFGQLDRLATLDFAEALSELEQAGHFQNALVAQLIDAALERTEAEPASAEKWLTLAATVGERIAAPAALRGQLDYARARLYVQQGQLTLAETAVRAAQAVLAAVDDVALLARSQLGLTQILAMQGRYSEAEAAAEQAILSLPAEVAAGRTSPRLLASAHRNLATVRVYQERHGAALASYAEARQVLEAALNDPALAEVDLAEMRRELGHLCLNQASAYMFLDRTYEAEAALATAISLFEELGDGLNRGRSLTNLGALQLRAGRFAAALSQFTVAARELVGDLPLIGQSPSAVPGTVAFAQLRNADILFIDQATAFLAVNLLPEAAETLERGAMLFRSADQPYELGQTLFLQGLVYLRMGDSLRAETALLEAERLFAGLQNRFWGYRTAVALATLAYQRGNLAAARTRLAALTLEPTAAADPTASLTWDLASWVEAQLLWLRIDLAQHQVSEASARLAALQARLGISEASDPQTLELPFPHLVARTYHAAGLVAQAAGDAAGAQRALQMALALVEQQRATLPVEEIRVAFLDDKTSLYSDLILSLLEPNDADAISAAFAVIERARSRVLLERLQSALAGSAATVGDEQAVRRQALQDELHLLYNRLLGASSSRQVHNEVSEQIRVLEAGLRQLDWATALPLPEAEPVALGMLQAALAADQQALLYYVAGDEVMAFVVSRTQATVHRQLCHASELASAAANWRFQLGRANMAPDYLARHAKRFAQAWRTALARLYELLIAPLAAQLITPRLLLIPFGELHQLPLPIVWTGQEHLLECFECTYAPSATMAVRLLNATQLPPSFNTLAALAVTDVTIPAARLEVEAAARSFDTHWLYLDDQANLAGLQAAATQADVLHLATHGLFRPDNPFFSVLKLADQWVDIRMLYQLPLAANLVVLSACESGASHVRGGDEVIGLARGFLAAGARALVVSLWHVSDAGAAALMADFYAYLTHAAAPMRPAAALRQAQLAALRKGRPLYEWAPFYLIGV